MSIILLLCRQCKAKSGERRIGRTAGGLNSKLHAVCDGNRRSVRIALTEGQRSDDDSAHLLLVDFPVAKQLLADKTYDTDWFGDTLAKRKISACIPARAKCSHPSIHDVRLHKQRHKSEHVRALERVETCRYARYDRCAHTFFSALYSAATGIFWL